ncbi:hypothetical protein [Olivibacter domesticus]|uniref:Secreted protein n=1 Tax=Olivibacter domesticus TaxID=407022 RepID=A0A1H7ILS9_OLID1|nr:hypothetical protein [Olivibacter domesticus]SEK61685.1 hypothetical protein SAMN05661044_00699 [Olivibacter domesticus]
MKSAKILLTALGVVSFVSAALAFKVRTENTFYKSNAQGICNVETQRNLTLAPPSPNQITTSLATTQLTTTCPVITVTSSL